MLTWIKRLFVPPVFEDKDQTRTADLLNKILLTILAATVVLFLDTLLAGRVGFIGPLIAVIVLCLHVLLRRGHVQVVSVLLSAGLLAIITLSNWLDGGVRNTAVSGYSLVLIIAGLLLGGRAVIVFGLLSALATLGLFYAEIGGAIVVPARAVAFRDWLKLSVILGTAALLLRFAVHSITQALERARRNERALAESNRELQREITERVRMEAALRESEGRLQGLFEALAEGIILIAPDGQIIHANPAAERILGLNRSEIESRHYVAPEWEILRSDGTPMPPEEMAGPRAMKEKRLVKDVVMGVKRPDGSVSWISVSAAPLMDGAGELEGIVGAFADVTEWVWAEEAYHTLVERSLQGLLIIQDGRIIFANPAIIDLSGYTLQELLSFPLDDLQTIVHPKDRERIWKNLQDRLAGKPVPSRHEFRFIRKDGQVRWVEALVRRVDYRDKLAMQIACIDITERVQAEEALREKEERYRAIFEQAADSIVLVDVETGAVVEFNDRAHENLGYTREEFQKLKIADFEFIESAEQVAKHLEKVVKEGGDTFATKHRTKDGEVRDILVNARAISIRGRDFVQSIWRDITERVRAEEQIKASLREKEVLLQEIHHRVKNNLQIISSLLDLQSAHIQDKRVLEMFQESQHRVRSMALVHEQLYRSPDLSRIDFAEHIRKLVDELLLAYGASAAAIIFKIDAGDVVLGVDTAIPCGLIIHELVSNALKYAFPEGREGEIHIALDAVDNDRLALIVRDNGVGLPKDLDLQNVETLGLRLVSMLTRQLKGTLELDRNGGSTFKIAFAKRES